jgi:hypothetical protein
VEADGGEIAGPAVERESCRAVAAGPVTGGRVVGPEQEDRQEHQARAVRGRHEERPQEEIAEADPHADPPGMARPHQLQDPGADECARGQPLEDRDREAGPPDAEQEEGEPDRGRVADRDRRQGAPDGAPVPFL